MDIHVCGSFIEMIPQQVAARCIVFCYQHNDMKVDNHWPCYSFNNQYQTSPIHACLALYTHIVPVYIQLVSQCSGYHVRFTRGRAWVRAPAKPSFFTRIANLNFRTVPQCMINGHALQVLEFCQLVLTRHYQTQSHNLCHNGLVGCHIHIKNYRRDNPIKLIKPIYCMVFIGTCLNILVINILIFQY